MFVCAPHVCQQRASDPPELELQMVVNCPVGVGNRAPNRPKIPLTFYYILFIYVCSGGGGRTACGLRTTFKGGSLYSTDPLLEPSRGHAEKIFLK